MTRHTPDCSILLFENCALGCSAARQRRSAEIGTDELGSRVKSAHARARPSLRAMRNFNVLQASHSHRPSMAATRNNVLA